MDESARETIGFYDANAASYVAETADVEFGELQREFARRLPKGGRVLDLGCGSGRDSLAFLKAGFSVDAVDGSARMVKAASKLTRLPVTHATFSDYKPQGPYDGIWACSSLLHVPASELPAVISKYARVLKPGGTFYLSFKLGAHDGMRGGRWFTDLDEPALRALIAEVPGLRIDLGTADCRDGTGPLFGSPRRAGPAPQNGPFSTFVKQSCSTDQNRLENQPEMVHPARMARQGRHDPRKRDD